MKVKNVEMKIERIEKISLLVVEVFKEKGAEFCRPIKIILIRLRKGWVM